MDHKYSKIDLPLPPGLIRLLTLGVWPKSRLAMNSLLNVTQDQVRNFAPDESQICFEKPPFRTMATEIAWDSKGVFWPRFGSLHQIVPEKTLIIGDFGIGSDSPIILDYARNASNPPVLRLRYNADRTTEWVQGADSFNDFAMMLGLFDHVA